MQKGFAAKEKLKEMNLLVCLTKCSKVPLQTLINFRLNIKIYCTGMVSRAHTIQFFIVKLSTVFTKKSCENFFFYFLWSS